MKINDSTYSTIEQFAQVARQYCAWADGNLGETQEEVRRAGRLLAELHLAALRLPDLGPGEDRGAVRIPQDEWLLMYQKFGKLPLASYWDVFNPLEAEGPILNDLADDLADIYRDVKSGLSLFESQHLIEAAWDWRLNFQIHWGRHLVGAQRAIHEYLSKEGL